MENSLAGLKMSLVDSQLLHGIFVQNDDAAAAIYQNSGEVSSPPLRGKGGIQHQGIGTRRRHHFRVVSTAPADRLLRSVHELWGSRGNYIHFSVLLTSAMLVVGHVGEDDISSVFFREFILDAGDWTGRLLLRRRQRRLASRRREQQSFALGDSGEPMALPGDVAGRLCAAMELAGSIKGLLIGEGG